MCGHLLSLRCLKGKTLPCELFSVQTFQVFSSLLPCSIAGFQMPLFVISCEPSRFGAAFPPLASRTSQKRFRQEEQGEMLWTEQFPALSTPSFTEHTPVCYERGRKTKVGWRQEPGGVRTQLLGEMQPDAGIGASLLLQCVLQVSVDLIQQWENKIRSGFWGVVCLFYLFLYIFFSICWSEVFHLAL